MLNTNSLSELGYDLSDDASSLYRDIAKLVDEAQDLQLTLEELKELFDDAQDAQDAIDEYASVLDEELSENGYYKRGVVSREAIERAEARCITTMTTLRDRLQAVVTSE